MSVVKNDHPIYAREHWFGSIPDHLIDVEFICNVFHLPKPNVSSITIRYRRGLSYSPVECPS